MNGFPSTIKLSALRGTYSRVVARVSLKVNADLPRKKKKVHWDTRLYSCSFIIHDFIVRICDCKMDSQNLYRPGSHVRRKCKRKSRPRVHAVFTLRLHLRLRCPSLHVWIANECVNAKARKIIRISPFLHFLRKDTSAPLDISISLRVSRELIYLLASRYADPSLRGVNILHYGCNWNMNNK